MWRLTPFSTVRVCPPIGNDLVRSVTVITPELPMKEKVLKRLA
jgi:hypothetical protein